MGQTSSLTVKEHSIVFKQGDSKLLVSEDKFIVKAGGDTIEIEQNGLFAKSSYFNAKAFSNVCVDRDCVKFDCNERVKIRNGEIYCGDTLYYEHTRDGFISKRS